MTTNEAHTLAERYTFWLAYYSASRWQLAARNAALDVA
jgi:hypothetical protein